MIKIGNKVLVTADKKKREGKVFYENEYFIADRFKHYNNTSRR